MTVTVAVLTPHLSLDRALVALVLADDVLHVDEAHVLRMRDDAMGQQGLDDRQSGQGDVVSLLVHINDGSNWVLRVLHLQ